MLFVKMKKKGEESPETKPDVFKIDHLTNRFPENKPVAFSPGDVLKINGSAGSSPSRSVLTLSESSSVHILCRVNRRRALMFPLDR